MPASLPLGAGEGPVCSWLAVLWYLLNPLFLEWAKLHVRVFCRKVLSLFLFFLFFFFPLSLAIPQFGLLSHVSSLRLSSEHSGLVLTLSTDYAAHTSLSSPHWLVADVSICATSLLAVVVRHVFCFVLFFFFSFFPILLTSEIPKLPTDLPMQGFPIVWKLLLLHNFLPRMGLHP